MYLFPVQESPLVSLDEILSSLTLREDTRFDQRDDRRDPLNVGFCQAAEDSYRYRSLARMVLPEVNERSGINTNQGMGRQIRV